MPLFTTATPSQINEVWARLLPGLYELHRTSPSQDWTIEDVREMLDDDMASLILADEEPGSFAIVHVQPSPLKPSELELFIFLAWHPGGEGIPRFQPQFDEMARKVNAKFIRFRSGRAGMLRLAPLFGYHARSVEYVKEI